MSKEVGRMGVKEEAIDAFKIGEQELRNAEKFIEIDLPISANRIYVAGENLAFSLLLAVHGSSTRDHGKIWNGIQELYDRGIIRTNFRPVLETSYKLRIKGDYGRDIGETTVVINKDILNSQIKNLNEFLKEVERILKEKKFID